METLRIAEETALYLYQTISETAFDALPSNDAKICALHRTLEELLHALTADEPQLFTDAYSRLVFVADKYATPDYIVRELSAFCAVVAQARRRLRRKQRAAAFTPKNPSCAGSPDDSSNELILSCAKTLAEAIFFYSEVPAPESLRSALRAAPPLPTGEAASSFASREGEVRALRLYVKSWRNIRWQGCEACEIEAQTEDGENVIARLFDIWTQLGALLWESCLLYCSHLRRANNDEASDEFTTKANAPQTHKLTYESTPETVVVLEPDYLLDATDLADCVVSFSSANSPMKGNPRILLLKKFMPVEPNAKMTLGNIANFCFDALLMNADASFDLVFEQAVQENPLAVACLQRDNPDAPAELRREAETIFENIKATLAALRWDKASVEPSFISPLYGLQGRLDLLVEYDDDARRKTIVELKSGKPPDTGAWDGNSAQVTVYNLLLDSCYPERSGDSCIFYARRAERALRNIPNDAKSKRETLALRNAVVAQERALADRKTKQTLGALNFDSFGLCSSFIKDDLHAFSAAYAALSPLEKKYVLVFAAFVCRENWAARVGSDRADGFSALWRKSIAEKKSAFSILSGLRLDAEHSDFTRLHLVFRRPAAADALANLRVGDIVVAYPVFENDDEQAFLRAPLFKGSLIDLSRQSVTVSLRNKLINVGEGSTEDWFLREAEWTLEPDFFASDKAQYQSLYEFMRAPIRSRRLLLGDEKPQFDARERENVLRRIAGEETAENGDLFSELSHEQRELLASALSARDYFLLQGPPGTGKTSKMLKSIAAYLFRYTQENALFIAFTNRATDEICEALRKAGVEYIRLGSKEASKRDARSLPTLAEGKSADEIFETLTRARVVVSTIASLQRNRDILQMIPFQTLVVDEASQVTEPAIAGFFASIQRRILIGDEKQLPAVAAQPESGVFTGKDAMLTEAGFTDLRISLFERLLRRCQASGWNEAFGVIKRQGRMHEEIAAFPNRAFYEGKLEPLFSWQNAAATLPREETERLTALGADFPELAPALPILVSKRLAFWNSPAEMQTKIHAAEARRAAQCAELFYRSLGENANRQSVGIIAPFRAQIAAIYRELPEELHDLVSVDTVERYQGSERDIIIVSFAVNFSSQLRSIESLSPDRNVDRKLNVALTRARQRLILLGRAQALSHSPIFRALVEHARDGGGYID
jgi:DNA replication ATP-dependent helicase Dna2